MALFNRDKEQPQKVEVPAEIQDYYQSERRERTGIAWLLALATLVITVIAVLGLFTGGRWVYRKYVQKDKPQTVVQESNDEADEKKDGEGSSESENLPVDQPEGSTSTPPAETPSTPTPPTSPPATTPSILPSSNNPAPNNSTATGGASPQASSTTVPRTGPANIVGVFIGITVVASLFHYFVLSKRTSVN
jgi:hypothetical protein